MANATLKEILDKLGDDRWIMSRLTEQEAGALGSDLEGFHGALRKAKYTVNVVLGIKGKDAEDMIITMLKEYLKPIITKQNQQTP